MQSSCIWFLKIYAIENFFVSFRHDRLVQKCGKFLISIITVLCRNQWKTQKTEMFNLPHEGMLQFYCNLAENPLAWSILTSSLLSFFKFLTPYMLKHPNSFHCMQVPIGKLALLFFHKRLFTILAITSEPFEVFSCVTTHLKAKNPRYKDHVSFFIWAILEKWYMFPGQW